MAKQSKSEYERVFGEKRRGGRPAMDPEEKVTVKARQRIEYRRRGEARRRAVAVLVHRYPDEFKAIMKGEYEVLEGNPKFDVKLINN